MTPNLVETFKLELRECIMTAERLASRPLSKELKLAVDLVRALDGLDPLLQKAVDKLWDEAAVSASSPKVREERRNLCPRNS